MRFLFSFVVFLSSVNSFGAVINGRCPRLDEVGVKFDIRNTTQPRGGWTGGTMFYGAGDTAVATSYADCRTSADEQDAERFYNVLCMYNLAGNNPSPKIRVAKVFPKSYDCRCARDTGEYRCEN